MGITKSHIFNQDQKEAATITKVLGHPARIAIIQHLSTHANANCNDLVHAIGLAQPTISQHLSEIKRADLLVQKTVGKNIFYTINVARLNQCRRIINDFFVKVQVNCSQNVS